MCRLFGMIAGGDVDLRFSMLDAPIQFHARGHTNPDGWGMGFYVNGEPRLLKHELPAKGDLRPEQGEGNARGRLLMAHVRRSSRAPRAAENCHPFTHDGWLFAHNGALFPLLEKWVRKQVGTTNYEGHTESEAIFRWILMNIERTGSAEKGIFAAVTPLIADGQFSCLNFLLARKDRLYAFRYATRSLDYYSLYYLRRPAGREIVSTSRDVHSHLETRGLVQHQALIVASETLTQEPWQALGLGELLSAGEDLEVKITPLVPK